jgi:hypothetical protein
MSDELSIVKLIRPLGMIYNICKEIIALCKEVKETQREILVIWPIVLQSWCQRVPIESIAMHGHSRAPYPCARLQSETARTRRTGKTVVGVWYATQPLVSLRGEEPSAIGLSPTAQIEQVNPDWSFPPEQNILLLMCGDFPTVRSTSTMTHIYVCNRITGITMHRSTRHILSIHTLPICQ